MQKKLKKEKKEIGKLQKDINQKAIKNEQLTI